MAISEIREYNAIASYGIYDSTYIDMFHRIMQNTFYDI